ncbi:MAG: Rpn family recombination-promoting nuclease/putative transposase, partial [Selenomonadaceae bacterium]|nr:Rpn family recombination-promoting nuclease/putative transposase [Selenomonadaceae bacterium]
NEEAGFLPKRTRYYQSMIDLNSLDKGDDYVKLNKSVVVFICTFDPFPRNRRKMYTFTNLCHEQDRLELGDETIKIFLNTKGKVGEVNEDIGKFLAYVEGKSAEGEFTKNVAYRVDKLKRHDETRLEYMTLMMEINEQRRDAYNMGRNEGRNEGRNDAKFEFAHSLVEKEGWSLDKTFDFLAFSPEDRVLFSKQLQ